MKLFFLLLLLPVYTEAQQRDTILTYLGIPVNLNEPIDSVKCAYYKNEIDSKNLQIPWLTQYRFYPKPVDSVRSFNFNIDSCGNICSIVLVYKVDTAYFMKLMNVLGKPSRVMTFSNGFSPDASADYLWIRESFYISISTIFNRQSMIIYRLDFKLKDYSKFHFHSLE